MSFSKKKYNLKIFLILLTAILLIISLMRPQWGFRWQKVQRMGVDILIALDVSKSMLAEDIKPNRLERAKLAIKDLVKKLRGDRIGLIAFAGSAFLECPLTLDYGGFLLVLNQINPSLIPRGGTAISKAISLARKSYEGGQKKYKALVIITDGEDHEGEVLSMAELARKEGIKIFCIGVGTREGELIPVKDEKAGRRFLKDREGNFVKSRLNEELLEEIALKTGGSYVRATPADFGLDLVYEKKISKMEKRLLKSKLAKQYEERFQLPLLIAFILLSLETVLTTYKDERR